MASDAGCRFQSRLVDLLEHYPVVEALSSYLTVADFLVLCQTCKGLSGLKECILKKTASINTRLKDFVDDPAAFRAQLGRLGALITGPFALNLFELGPRTVKKLDVFVQTGDDAIQFQRHIQDHEGYKRRKPQGDSTTRKAPAIFSRSTRPEMKLRVTWTFAPPIQAILTSSRTTANLNVITWNKAYSIFPRPTLIDHRFFLLGPLNDDVGSTLSEISQQGWTTRDIIWADFAAAQTSGMLGVRRVGDKSTLVIPLDTGSVQASSVRDFTFEYSQFSVGQSQIYVAAGLFLDAAIKIASPALRYTCTGSLSPQWFQYVRKRLDRWAWLEWYKLEPDNRPIQPPDAVPFTSNLYIPRGFMMPQSWDYADDQIPQWYREWEMEYARR